MFAQPTKSCGTQSCLGFEDVETLPVALPMMMMMMALLLLLLLLLEILQRAQWRHPSRGSLR